MSHLEDTPPDDRGEREVVLIDQSLAPLVPKFLAHRRAEVLALADYLAASDFDAVRRTAHTIKGVGGSYGFDRLTDIGTQMELAAKAADAIGVAQTLQDVRLYLERIDIVYR